jgi:hypothetical protein
MVDVRRSMGHRGSTLRKVVVGMLLFGLTIRYTIDDWRTMGPPPILLLGPPIGLSIVGYALGKRRACPNCAADRKNGQQFESQQLNFDHQSE